MRTVRDGSHRITESYLWGGTEHLPTWCAPGPGGMTFRVLWQDDELLQGGGEDLPDTRDWWEQQADGGVSALNSFFPGFSSILTGDRYLSWIALNQTAPGPPSN